VYWNLVTLENLNLLAFLVSLGFLVLSAYSDLKTREVSNWVWAAYLPVAMVILGLRLFVAPGLLIVSLVSILSILCISYLMFRFGLFGGADLKALACLGVALPTAPMTQLIPSTTPNPLFPLAVLYNAYFFSVSVILYSFVRNVYWKSRKGRMLFTDYVRTSLGEKVVALLSGYRTDFETLRRKVHLYPMEEIRIANGVTYRRLKFSINAEADRNQLINSLEPLLSDSQKEAVWVSPGIPLLFFIMIALISTGLICDALLWIIIDAMRIL